jgi:hypothetical protein
MEPGPLPREAGDKPPLSHGGGFLKYENWPEFYLEMQPELLSHHFVYVMKTGHFTFKVCRSMHHHIIQINHELRRCNNFSSLLLDVYFLLNMYRAPSRPSSGAQQLQ